jgi:hypothetical protein
VVAEKIWFDITEAQPLNGQEVWVRRLDGRSAFVAEWDALTHEFVMENAMRMPWWSASRWKIRLD